MKTQAVDFNVNSIAYIYWLKKWQGEWKINRYTPVIAMKKTNVLKNITMIFIRIFKEFLCCGIPCTYRNCGIMGIRIFDF